MSVKRAKNHDQTSAVHDAHGNEHRDHIPATNHEPPHGGPLHAVNERLEHFSRWVTHWAGSSWAFAIAVAVVLVWIVTGPLFGFSDTWQLVINTGTTIVTFLMVFLIQRSQNKESLAIQIKLNELLASQSGASNQLINVEDLSEEEIEELHREFSQLTEHLANAADDRAPHSIAEAHSAIARAEQTLKQVRHRAGQRPRHPKNNGRRAP
jgi:low affinity Fe/Cu permease